MANKQSIAQRKIVASKNKFLEENKKLRRFNIVGILGLIITFLTFFCVFAEIYNTTEGVGVEVKVRGFSFLVAGITGKYSSTSSTYGDMAVPFYYYAKTWCETIGTLTLIAGILLVLSIVLKTLSTIFNYNFLSFVFTVLDVVLSVLLIIVFVKALDMSNSEILPIYCSGNPACSIKSYAIVPALVGLCVALLDGFIAFKYFLICKNHKNSVKGAKCV